MYIYIYIYIYRVGRYKYNMISYILIYKTCKFMYIYTNYKPKTRRVNIK